MSIPCALRSMPTDKESEKGRVDQTRVRRYWAGKAPEWAADASLAELQLGDREAVRTEIAAPTIIRKADPRLSRLAASRAEDVEEVRERHREIRAAEIVRRRHDDAAEDAGRRDIRSEDPDQGAETHSDSEEDDELDQDSRRHRHAQQEEEDEEEQLRKRQAVRERLLLQQKAVETQVAAQHEEEEEEEESSEYETDSDEEGAPGRRLLKPVFVPKESRETIAERLRQEQEEIEALEKEKKRAEERKLETRQIVAQTVAADALAAKAAAEEVQAAGVAGTWAGIVAWTGTATLVRSAAP
ncbi:MFAP1 domain-containing protein [Haematococcus lacustris]|uniref:MFAP1 domain-containing protein n=1 Tax=Haematococcus lacustris TaxID=44745 RepID=A0A699YZ96_HAELA|nr:MFAP1 domain-containing protein [Haematococcus lacustris]